MEIQWQEHSLDDVLRYFVQGFEPKNGKVVYDFEGHVDVINQKVIFRLYLEDEK